MNSNYLAACFTITLASLLAGCGGSGGGGSGAAPSTGPGIIGGPLTTTAPGTAVNPIAPGTSVAPVTPVTPGISPISTTCATTCFPLQRAYNKRLVSGYDETYVITGDCTGKARVTTTPATTATRFEGVDAFSQTQTATVAFEDFNGVKACEPKNSSVSSTVYFNAGTYALIGSSAPGTYSLNLTTVPLPANVEIGGRGTYTTLILFPDSQKTEITGRTDVEYVVEPDTTPTTAIVNLITRGYDRANTLLYTSQSRYRIDTTGDFFTPVSEDDLYGNGLRLMLKLQP